MRHGDIPRNPQNARQIARSFLRAPQRLRASDVRHAPSTALQLTKVEKRLFLVLVAFLFAHTTHVFSTCCRRRVT